MQISHGTEGEYLLLMLASGKEIKVYEDHGARVPRLSIRDVHQSLMEASK
jgi:hypothetical protein